MEQSLRRQADVVGRKVTIVDTPNWDWVSVRRTMKQGADFLQPSRHITTTGSRIWQGQRPELGTGMENTLELHSLDLLDKIEEIQTEW